MDFGRDGEHAGTLISPGDRYTEFIHDLRLANCSPLSSCTRTIHNVSRRLQFEIDACRCLAKACVRGSSKACCQFA